MLRAKYVALDSGLEVSIVIHITHGKKGGGENLNKLVRQYLPRKTDMSKVTDEDIYNIPEQLNNRPWKILNYKTPNEVATKFIKSGVVNT